MPSTRSPTRDGSPSVRSFRMHPAELTYLKFDKCKVKQSDKAMTKTLAKAIKSKPHKEYTLLGGEKFTFKGRRKAVVLAQVIKFRKAADAQAVVVVTKEKEKDKKCFLTTMRFKKISAYHSAVRRLTEDTRTDVRAANVESPVQTGSITPQRKRPESTPPARHSPTGVKGLRRSASAPRKEREDGKSSPSRSARSPERKSRRASRRSKSRREKSPTSKSQSPEGKAVKAKGLRGRRKAREEKRAKKASVSPEKKSQSPEPQKPTKVSSSSSSSSSKKAALPPPPRMSKSSATSSSDKSKGPFADASPTEGRRVTYTIRVRDEGQPRSPTDTSISSRSSSEGTKTSSQNENAPPFSKSSIKDLSSKGRIPRNQPVQGEFTWDYNGNLVHILRPTNASPPRRTFNKY